MAQVGIRSSAPEWHIRFHSKGYSQGLCWVEPWQLERPNLQQGHMLLSNDLRGFSGPPTQAKNLVSSYGSGLLSWGWPRLVVIQYGEILFSLITPSFADVYWSYGIILWMHLATPITGVKRRVRIMTVLLTNIVERARCLNCCGLVDYRSRHEISLTDLAIPM